VRADIVCGMADACIEGLRVGGSIQIKSRRIDFLGYDDSVSVRAGNAGEERTGKYWSNKNASAQQRHLEVHGKLLK
jgi:hypothetical protein